MTMNRRRQLPDFWFLSCHKSSHKENEMFATQRGLRKAAAALATLLVMVSSVGTVLAASPATDAAGKAMAWMKSQQQPDGGFQGFGAGSSIDAVLAIVAAGADPATYAQGGNDPVNFLQSKAADLSKTAGGAGKLLVAASALGRDGKAFGGVDLVQAVQATYGISATGQYGPDAIGHAFSIIGLNAAGVQVPAEAVARLKSLQTPEGGWAFSGDTAANSADTNTTAVALQALAAVGADKTDPDVVKRGLAYLSGQQNTDKGWPYQKGSEFGSDSDVNSTAYVVQALNALQNTATANEGIQFLLSMQNASGAFGYQKVQPEDNPGATYQAVPAVLGATLISPKAGTVQPVASGSGPGMPRTGNEMMLPVAALVLVSTLLVTMGVVARRKGEAR
jgi:prenyltransferase beta subunit